MFKTVITNALFFSSSKFLYTYPIRKSTNEFLLQTTTSRRKNKCFIFMYNVVIATSMIFIFLLLAHYLFYEDEPVYCLLVFFNWYIKYLIRLSPGLAQSILYLKIDERIIRIIILYCGIQFYIIISNFWYNIILNSRYFI